MTVWDAETAEWYAQNYGEYATNRLAVNALDIASDSTIVDIGCGTGSALRHAAERVISGTLIGIDPVSRMIEIAQERTINHPASARIVFQQGAAEALPLEDGCADIVFAFDSFDHWVDQLAGLAEIHRILHADGELVVVKDGALPGGAAARRAFVETLRKVKFSIIEERRIEEGDVSFTMWKCRIDG